MAIVVRSGNVMAATPRMISRIPRMMNHVLFSETAAWVEAPVSAEPRAWTAILPPPLRTTMSAFCTLYIRGPGPGYREMSATGGRQMSLWHLADMPRGCQLFAPSLLEPSRLGAWQASWAQ